MDINIKTINFDADSKLTDFVKAKVSKLEKYFDGIIRAEVYLDFDKSKTKKTENKITRIKIEIPGNDLFAEKDATTFEQATDDVIDALSKQVKKYKSKLK